MASDDLFLHTVGVSDRERALAATLPREGTDPVVSVLIGATNGYAYKHLIGQQFDYPIPELPLPDGQGKTLLDIGCGWGRWTIAAARKGYSAIGIDPSQGSILAAQRVAGKLGARCLFEVGDGRCLRFPDNSFDAVFSFSVVQHFSRSDARLILSETSRVLKPGGVAKIQMARWLGARSIYILARRGFREGRDFEVRYWSTRELKRAFSECIGPCEVSVHAYGGLGLLACDIHLMPPRIASLIRISEFLRRSSNYMPLLGAFADSVWVTARKM